MKALLKSLGRRILYQPRGMTIGKATVIRRPRWIVNPSGIRIGDSTRVKPYGVLVTIPKRAGVELGGRITIGNDVYIGGWTQIHAMNHIEIEDGAVLELGR